MSHREKGMKAGLSQVLEFFAEQGEVSTEDLMRRFGYTYRGARSRLQRLQRSGLVTRLSLGRYRLTEEGYGRLEGVRSGEGGARNEGEERPVPSEEEAFAEVLRLFRVPDKVAQGVANYVSTVGPSDVWENPKELAKGLKAWADEGLTPSKRLRILRYWFSRRGIPLGEELLREGEGVRGRRGEERKAKFAVDEETGRIRQARRGEVPLTLEEARALSAEIKEERRREKASRKEEEPPFLVGEDGRVRLNPKARLTVLDLLAWEAVRRRQDRGKAWTAWG